MSTTLDTSVTPAMAEYIMSLPDRHLGYWDDEHLRAVTGYDWTHWRAVFAVSRGFESVFRSLTTEEYLVQSGRWSSMLSRTPQSARSGQ